LIQIPKEIYHGWMCVSTDEAVIINIPSEPYNSKKPDEHRIDPHQNDIPYDWRRKDG
jgi:dTDP-4-dehydrorhamnose 3,5-epimerase